jgi:transposase InsO family protein
MKDNMNRFPIEKMSKVLRVSRSGYYGWLSSGPSTRNRMNAELTEGIRKVFMTSRSTYGSPRITAELNVQGIRVSRPRVARLMKASGIRSCIGKRYRVCTTDSNHGFHIAPNLLDRNFSTDAVGRAWVSDITYVRTAQGWSYLTTVIDLADRMVIGWAMDSSMKATNTSVAAWNMAVANRPVNTELMFHSDRGVQYACKEFTDLVGAFPKVKRSMSRKGNCWDNAVAESFFKTLKSECTDRQKFNTRNDAEMAIFEYIETWYNTRRRHSTLNYMTPLEYSNQLQTRKIAA